MSPEHHMALSDWRLSVDYDALINRLASERDFLIIQDLDGVCMPLVNDPLTRVIDRAYVRAAARLEERFFVLTQGEHSGKRGVNAIIERAFAVEGLSKKAIAEQGLFLPGLGAGGVQLQNRRGKSQQPGVRSEELAFLFQVPVKARYFLINRLGNPPYSLAPANLQLLAESVVLDNRFSPTINANLLVAILGSTSTCRQLQQELQHFMAELLREAEREGLADSFFVHYAPNLGRDEQSGAERIQFAEARQWGTTDFQFMLTGALKQAGVLVLLNQYFGQRYGDFPLGEDFNVRQAPQSLDGLLALAIQHFDPERMPRLIGVGDTITSHIVDQNGEPQRLRGGSDRDFLQLIQQLGQHFGSDNLVALVDSSAGEVSRPAVNMEAIQQHQPSDSEYWQALEGLSDADDPLQINLVFPNGAQQYIQVFKQLVKGQEQNG